MAQRVTSVFGGHIAACAKTTQTQDVGSAEFYAVSHPSWNFRKVQLGRSSTVKRRCHRHHVAGGQLAEHAEKLAAVAVHTGHLLAVDVPAGASGGTKLVKLAVEGLPVSGYAGIADEPFFSVSFDHNLCRL